MPVPTLDTLLLGLSPSSTAVRVDTAGYIHGRRDEPNPPVGLHHRGHWYYDEVTDTWRDVEQDRRDQGAALDAGLQHMLGPGVTIRRDYEPEDRASYPQADRDAYDRTMAAVTRIPHRMGTREDVYTALCKALELALDEHLPLSVARPHPDAIRAASSRLVLDIEEAHASRHGKVIAVPIEAPPRSLWERLLDEDAEA